MPFTRSLWPSCCLIFFQPVQNRISAAEDDHATIQTTQSRLQSKVSLWVLASLTSMATSHPRAQCCQLAVQYIQQRLSRVAWAWPQGWGLQGMPGAAGRTLVLQITKPTGPSPVPLTGFPWRTRLSWVFQGPPSWADVCQCHCTHHNHLQLHTNRAPGLA